MFFQHFQKRRRRAIFLLPACKEIQSHFELDKINSDVRVRYYLDPVDQEILLSELSLNSKAELKSEILFFTSAERKVGSVHLITTIKGKFQLESQKV